ncbi:MAG: ABC transporter permease [Anaerolineae bacterium]|nr:ABC transporter permease [Anaerolineae bacterium]
MSKFTRDLNAIVAIAAREVMNFTRTPAQIIFVLLFPAIFLGVLGGNLEQNLGGSVGFNFMQFMFFGVVVSTLYQTTFTSVIKLIEDRENDFTQEIFVAPISRYAMILGKIFGGTITSFLSLLGLLVMAVVLQIPLTLAQVGNVILMWPIICVAAGTLGIVFIGIVNDPRTADTGSFMIIIPQMFLAGIMTPVTNSSGLLGVLAHMMPMTYLADLMRNIVYAGSPEHSQIVLYSPAVDLAVVVVVSATFLIVGTLLFTRSSRAR